MQCDEGCPKVFGWDALETKHIKLTLTLVPRLAVQLGTAPLHLSPAFASPENRQININNLLSISFFHSFSLFNG